MDKEELGRNITNMFRDEDKEKAHSLLSEIDNYISDFYNENIKLNAIYDEIRLSSSQVEVCFVIKHTTLNLKLDGSIIKVLKIENDNVTKLDDIVIEKGNVSCKHGEFTLKEVDNYLVECFQDLF